MASNRTLHEPTDSARAAAGRSGAHGHRRRGETIRTWFRSDRVFNQDGAWFISTREGINVGPYATRKQAESDVQPLIEHLSERRTGLAIQDDALTIRQFIERPRARARS